ncbi:MULTISPECIES: hypothetical protein [Streptomyces]|uniref:Chitinase n=2 Tax=Streptomyces TaxID=1883 RepID=A0A101PKU6_STRCK|nr:hypothetical protein [Streptomyces corchorusii]KUN13356.1 hypothetical protein AQJ11_44890 [Streptomyces corchorusii]
MASASLLTALVLGASVGLPATATAAAASSGHVGWYLNSNDCYKAMSKEMFVHPDRQYSCTPGSWGWSLDWTGF